MTTGYLGPAGTFSQQAALYYAQADQLRAYAAIDEALSAVEAGEVEQCVVPLENSIEGTVNVTLDTLIFDTCLFIQSELKLPIAHNLMTRENVQREQIQKILSHPQPLAQCRKYLQTNFKGVETMPVSSSAEAARIVSQSSMPTACIGTALAAELYGLTVLAKDLQDEADNFTNFLLMSRKNTASPSVGRKTSLAFSTVNEPGALYKVLNIFSLWDINMTRILSRPMKQAGGSQYVFYIDIEGFTDQMDVEEALSMVRRKTIFFKLLGSYEVRSSSSSC